MRIQKRQLPVREFDSIARTTCPLCGSGCGLKVFIKAGRAVDIYGDEENQLNKGSLCPRPISALLGLNHDQRLLTPSIRNRLGDPFREATWDEAFDFLVDKLRQSFRTSPESLYIRLSSDSGFGNIALGTLLGKYLGTPNIDSDLAAGSSAAATVLGHVLGVPLNGCAMSARHEWSSSQSIIVVGADPATTDPVTFGAVLDAKDRGTKLIVVDCRNTMTMRKADLALKCRVGTEAAVLMGMAHVILGQNLGNEDFLKQWVDGVEEFQSLCGNFAPERSEAISGVKKEIISKAARITAKNFPSMVMGVSRPARQAASADLIFAMIGLTAITGTIGCPGGGLTFLQNFPPVEIRSEIPPAQKISLTSMNSVRGSGIWQVIAEDRPYPIRGIIWDTNPLRQCPEARKICAALRKMDLVVYLGQYPEAAYEHAHVFFPLTSFLETEGLVFSSTGRNIQWGNRTVFPPGKARPAEDFWGGLMARMGFSSSYPFIGEKGEVNIREMSAYFLQRSPLLAGITPELLDPEKNLPGGIQWPVPTGEIEFPNHRAAVRGTEGLFRPGSKFPGTDKRFPTPSGKIELSPAKILAEPEFQNLGRIPPENGLKGNQLILVIGETVDSFPAAGLPGFPQKVTLPIFAQIHPQRARQLGVKTGDRILIENARGRLESPAWVTDHVEENMVFCPAGTTRGGRNSPAGLFGFVPDEDGHGRRLPASTVVNVRKAS